MALTTPEEILTQLGIQIASVSDDEIAAKCPFHKDSHPSFSMSTVPKPNKDGTTRPAGLWVCYQCGRAGSIQTLVDEIGGGDVSVTEYLQDVRHKNVRKRSDLPQKPEEPAPLEPYLHYAKYESFRWPPAWALEERMITLNVAERYGIKWDKGWIIPIWAPEMDDDISGLWGWQFKRLDFVSNYPKAVKKSLTLFGLRELDSTTVVLVESPLDVCRLASAGVTAVASYGAFVSQPQLKLLEGAADRIILALDMDEEGQRQTNKIYLPLAKKVATSKVILPRGAKDPGDLSDAQVLKVFA